MQSSAIAWDVLWEEESARGRPLCVDLDGTLVSTDTLWECVLWLMLRRPWLLLVAPFWLLGGRASFKQRVAVRCVFDPAALPYREDLVVALRRLKQSGR